jgi:uncharacterized protein (DUF2062 family)
VTRRPGRRARLRRFLYRLRTEHTSPRRDAVAVGVGVFIGCTPFYGLHLILSVLGADLLRLNRLKVYLAANISNPLVLPFLVFAEVQAGAWLRSGRVHALSREAVTSVDPWIFGLDLVIGAVAIGAIAGGVIGALTYAATRDRAADPVFTGLVHRAAEHYALTSLTAWEFAHAKLRSDPVYRLAMRDDVLPGGGTLADIGCGQGLMLALLAEARRAPAAADLATRRWPTYQRLLGIETRPRVAAMAQDALGALDVEIVPADATRTPLPHCSAVLMFDVLQMMPRAAQDALVAAVRAAIAPEGVALVREADASAGWRFVLVRTGNRLKALAGRAWRQRFAFRGRDEWVACFRAHGFDVDVLPGLESHPFGNVLFRLRPVSPAAAGAAHDDTASRR